MFIFLLPRTVATFATIAGLFSCGTSIMCFSGSMLALYPLILTILGMSCAINAPATEYSVAGALIAHDMPRIVKINGYNASIEPEKHMILVPHENKPAMVAKVATVLGNKNINITRMNVAHRMTTFL